MKTGKIFVMAVTFGLLSACAPMSPYEAVDSPAVLKAVESARTRGDHAALSRYFENLAADMRTKAEEQRKLLQHFQEKSYLYGRQAQDRQSHTWALMHRYEQAAKASLGKAASHRQIAARLEPDERDSHASSDSRIVDAGSDATYMPPFQGN